MCDIGWSCEGQSSSAWCSGDSARSSEKSSGISALGSLGSRICSPAVFCMKRKAYVMESHDTSSEGGPSALDSFTISLSASLSDSPAVSFTVSQSELDLSNNNLQDSLEFLCVGLRSSDCELQILRLSCCNLGEKACENLKSVLLMENSLKELDLSNNDLQDSGVEQLCAGLKSSQCKLQILRLSGCMVTEVGFSSLASALRSNPSNLKELDLTYNHPGESGVKLLSARLEDPQCSLNTLRVEHGGKMRLKPGLKKYYCELTLDPDTPLSHLALSDGNRKIRSAGGADSLSVVLPLQQSGEAEDLWSAVQPSAVLVEKPRQELSCRRVLLPLFPFFHFLE
ncbi:hypothetical protein SRHO_G00189030 [Serrasalmus rhombeus]